MWPDLVRRLGCPQALVALPFREILRWRRLTDFRARAIERIRLRPSPLGDAPVDGLKELLQWAGDRYGLVGLHRERGLLHAFWLGQIGKLTDKAVVMKLIDRKGQWLGTYRAWLKTVTRVDFGGPYERDVESVLEQASPKEERRRWKHGG